MSHHTLYSVQCSYLKIDFGLIHWLLTRLGPRYNLPNRAHPLCQPLGAIWWTHLSTTPGYWFSRPPYCERKWPEDEEHTLLPLLPRGGNPKTSKNYMLSQGKNGIPIHWLRDQKKKSDQNKKKWDQKINKSGSKKNKSDQKKINLEHPSISCETSSKFHERNLQNKHFVRDFLQISQKTKANTLHVLFSFSVFFLVLMFFVSSYCSWKRCGGERSHP